MDRLTGLRVWRVLGPFHTHKKIEPQTRVSHSFHLLVRQVKPVSTLGNSMGYVLTSRLTGLTSFPPGKQH